MGQHHISITYEWATPGRSSPVGGEENQSNKEEEANMYTCKTEKIKNHCNVRKPWIKIKDHDVMSLNSVKSKIIK